MRPAMPVGRGTPGYVVVVDDGSVVTDVVADVASGAGRRVGVVADVPSEVVQPASAIATIAVMAGQRGDELRRRGRLTVSG